MKKKYINTQRKKKKKKKKKRKKEKHKKKEKKKRKNFGNIINNSRILFSLKINKIRKIYFLKCCSLTINK